MIADGFEISEPLSVRITGNVFSNSFVSSVKYKQSKTSITSQLSYVKPRMGENRFGGEAVTYEGVGSTKKWERIESYGPKFVENIVQAISRDILCYSIMALKSRFITMHIHDEIVIEADAQMSQEKICAQMGQTPPWAKDLLLRADGYECEFYKKD